MFDRLKIKIGKRALAFLLAVLMLPVTGLIPVRAQAMELSQDSLQTGTTQAGTAPTDTAQQSNGGADETDKAVPADEVSLASSVKDTGSSAGTGDTERAAVKDEYTYVMQISTGSNDGGNIAYITVEYLDVDNAERMKVIFPQTAYDIAQGYTDSSTGTSQLENRLDKAEKLGFSLDNWEVKTEALASNSTDSYVMTLAYEVREFTAIGIHANNGTTWDVKGIQLYEATEIAGSAMYGYISPDRYLKFSGRLMAQVQVNQDSLSLSFSNAGDDYFFGNSRQDSKKSHAEVLLSYPEKYNWKKADYADGNIVYCQFAEKSDYDQVTTYSTAGSEYLFRLDLADLEGSGIDTYNVLFGQKVLGGEDDYEECLSVTMRYVDTAGNYRKVFMPITISALTWAAEKISAQNSNSKNLLESISYFAQPGQSICFAGNFPGMDHVVEWYLCYGTRYVAEAAKNNGVGRKSTATIELPDSLTPSDDMDTRSLYLESINDSLYFTGISMFKLGSGSVANPTISNGTLEVKTGSIVPLSYYVSKSPEGTLLQAENAVDISETQIMQNTEEDHDVALKPSYGQTYYLVSITADDVDKSGTINDMSAMLHYKDSAGSSCTSEVIALPAAAQDLYGYWPAMGATAYQSYLSLGTSAGGATGALFYTSAGRLGGTSVTGASSNMDGAYRYYAQTGETLRFLVKLEDVQTFTGLTLAAAGGNLDEYQLSRIEIGQVVDLGDLKMTLQTTTLAFGEGAAASYTDRVWEREGITTNRLVDYEPDNPVLVMSGQQVEISFEDQTGNDIGSSGNDDNEAIGKKSVTYQEALRNYRVSESRVAYKVKVQVAKDENATLLDGDTGSQNQFYFQLVFDKDGKKYTSSYVNANQQVEGDGFRSGQPVTFTIYTNGDYGDLKAVNILPDDISAASDTFDKLKIDTITVTKSDANGSNLSYEIKDVGWIDIPFHDDQSEYIGSRTEEELVSTFEVSGTTVTTNLEFALVNSADTTDKGLKGMYKAVIYYKDQNNAMQHETYDLVEYLQEYITPGSLKSSGETDDRVSDTSYMFLPNATNRFIIPFTNIKSLDHVTFMVKSDDGTGKWGVTNLSVRQVSGDGVLRLRARTLSSGDSVSEYQRDYGDGNTLALCTQQDEGTTHSTDVGEDNFSSFDIYFSKNEIKASSGDFGGLVVEGEEPESKNDKADIQIIPVGNLGSLTNGDRILVTMKYQDVFGDDHVVENVPLVYRSANKCFLCEGSISAELFCIPTEISLTPAKSFELGAIRVRQIREGNVLNQFESFGVESGLRITEGATQTFHITGDQGNAKYTDKYSQMVYIGFAADSREATLDETKDVKVSFHYYVKDDASNVRYTTSTQSLRSLGITHVGPNMVVAVPFEAYQVERIEKVAISIDQSEDTAASDPMLLRVDRVAVRQNVRIGGSSGTTSVEGWFNCGLSQSAQLQEKKTYFQTVDATPEAGLANTGRLCPVEMTFTTADDEGSVSSGANGIVNLTVWYMDNNGALQSYTLRDAESCLSTGDFQSKPKKSASATEDGETESETTGEGTLYMLIPGVKQILSVTVETTQDQNGDGTTPQWKIGSVTVKSNSGAGALNKDQSLSQTLNKWVREAVSTTSSSDGRLEINISNISLTASLSWNSGEKTVNFNNTDEEQTPVLIDADSGLKLSITNTALSNLGWVYETAKVSGDAVGLAETIPDPTNFTLDNNTEYILTIHPSGLKSLSVSIRVKVEAKPVVTPETTSESSKSTVLDFNGTGGYVTGDY